MAPMDVQEGRFRLRQLRKEKGYTQQQLASAAGINPRHYRFIESLQMVPNVGIAIRICEALGVQVEDAFDEMRGGEDD